MDKPKITATYRGQETPEIRAYLDAIDKALNERNAAQAFLDNAANVQIYGHSILVMPDEGEFYATTLKPD